MPEMPAAFAALLVLASTKASIFSTGLATAIALRVSYWTSSSSSVIDAAAMTAQFRPLLMGRYGFYKVMLVLLIGGCMIAYAAIWRVSATADQQYEHHLIEAVAAHQ